MAENEKRYVSYLGYDYTDYVKTEEDEKSFYRLCECEQKSDGVPIKDCVQYVAEALNLDAKLRNLKRTCHVQGNVNMN